MLILFWVLLAGLIAWAIIDVKHDYSGYDGVIQTVLAVIFGIILVIVTSVMIGELFRIDRIIPNEIAYLEQNNAEIEAKLQETVVAYQTYESETFAELRPESSDVTVVISLYPELKSETLVAGLLDTYISNNDTIRDLELQRLQRPSYAFWLYFGG